MKTPLIRNGQTLVRLWSDPSATLKPRRNPVKIFLTVLAGKRSRATSSVEPVQHIEEETHLQTLCAYKTLTWNPSLLKVKHRRDL
jgi:hypothetical protein